MTASTIVPLKDFAATWRDRTERPEWAPPDSESPLPLDHLGLRSRIEDVVDTVVALQRAEWLHDGVYLGPRANPEIYRDVMHCARVLKVSVPPAITTAGVMRNQRAAGTDARPFLILSSFFFRAADKAERRFIAGRVVGHVALQQVTTMSVYALLVDSEGVRKVARKAVGPLLEVVLAPLGLGMRLALSRWHRAAEMAADRAGLLCCRDLDASRMALLRIALAVTPDVDPEAYLEQLRNTADDTSPGRWTELLQDEPWMHKRMMHLELFAKSQLYAQLTGDPEPTGISRDDLEQGTRDLLGVG